MQNARLDDAKTYVFQRLEKELPRNLDYHGIGHTRDSVLPAISKLSKLSGISEEDSLLLHTAALYHDIGFVEQHEKNEPIGVRIAKETLPKFGYNEKQIDAICEIIMATEMPQRPRTFLQELMCDADLAHLGAPDLLEWGEKLRKEFVAYGILPSSTTDLKWYENQIKFLGDHKYFTEVARLLLDDGKEKNIEELKRRAENLKSKI